MARDQLLWCNNQHGDYREMFELLLGTSSVLTTRQVTLSVLYPRGDVAQTALLQNMQGIKSVLHSTAI